MINNLFPVPVEYLNGLNVKYDKVHNMISCEYIKRIIISTSPTQKGLS